MPSKFNIYRSQHFMDFNLMVNNGWMNIKFGAMTIH